MFPREIDDLISSFLDPFEYIDMCTGWKWKLDLNRFFIQWKHPWPGLINICTRPREYFELLKYRCFQNIITSNKQNIYYDIVKLQGQNCMVEKVGYSNQHVFFGKKTLNLALTQAVYRGHAASAQYLLSVGAQLDNCISVNNLMKAACILPNPSTFILLLQLNHSLTDELIKLICTHDRLFHLQYLMSKGYFPELKYIKMLIMLCPLHSSIKEYLLRFV